MDLHEIRSCTRKSLEPGTSAKLLAGFIQRPGAIKIHINEKEYPLHYNGYMENYVVWEDNY